VLDHVGLEHDASHFEIFIHGGDIGSTGQFEPDMEVLGSLHGAIGSVFDDDIEIVPLQDLAGAEARNGTTQMTDKK
jgi:hypothetical protein